MIRKTEYAAQPEAYEIQRVGEKAFVRLRENIAELPATEIATPGEGEETQTVSAARWEADEYTVECRWAENLQERVAGNTAAWLAKAKADAAAREEAQTIGLTQEERLTSAEGTLQTHESEIEQIVTGLEALSNGA